MKTITFKTAGIFGILLCANILFSSSYAQGVVIFNENCSGNGNQQSPNTTQTSIASFENWSAIGTNGVTITPTTSQIADVRTNTILTADGVLVDNNHIYMAAKDVSFTINTINTSGYTDVKLTFDLAGASVSSTVAQNFNELKVYYKTAESNDSTEINIDSKQLLSTEKNRLLNAGQYSIPSSSAITLRFKNSQSVGKIFRLDNIVITGSPLTSSLNPSTDPVNKSVFTRAGTICIKQQMGSQLNVYTPAGMLLHKETVNSDDYTINFPQGMYIVRLNNQPIKVLVD